MAPYCRTEMSAQAGEQSHTTLWVRKETAERLDAMKEYDSITWDEWLTELADAYEERNQ